MWCGKNLHVAAPRFYSAWPFLIFLCVVIFQIGMSAGPARPVDMASASDRLAIIETFQSSSY